MEKQEEAARHYMAGFISWALLIVPSLLIYTYTRADTLYTLEITDGSLD